MVYEIIYYKDDRIFMFEYYILIVLYEKIIKFQKQIQWNYLLYYILVKKRVFLIKMKR